MFGSREFGVLYFSKLLKVARTCFGKQKIQTDLERIPKSVFLVLQMNLGGKFEAL